MENLITNIIVWLIINAIAVFRLAVFSGMNKKMVVFSLVIGNSILGGIIIVQHKGFENIDKTNLLIVGILLFILVFWFYYNEHDKE